MDNRFEYGEIRVYAIGIANGLEIALLYTDVTETERRIISGIESAGSRVFVRPLFVILLLSLDVREQTRYNPGFSHIRAQKHRHECRCGRRERLRHDSVRQAVFTTMAQILMSAASGLLPTLGLQEIQANGVRNMEVADSQK